MGVGGWGGEDDHEMGRQGEGGGEGEEEEKEEEELKEEKERGRFLLRLFESVPHRIFSLCNKILKRDEGRRCRASLAHLTHLKTESGPDFQVNISGGDTQDKKMSRYHLPGVASHSIQRIVNQNLHVPSSFGSRNEAWRCSCRYMFIYDIHQYIRIR